MPIVFTPAARRSAAAAALAGALVAGHLPAAAQMLDRPWQFSQTNRASIAFSLRDATRGGGGAAIAPAGPTIICGGGGSTAAGNNTCIVLNNADGQISLDQASDGSQNASNEQNQTTTTQSAPDSSAEEVLSILEGTQ